jgi:diapolycopene oxygenase
MSKQPVAAVIGGGLGGISAAISLAAAGVKVSLYERNEHLGGKLNLSIRDGFCFDLGPSIIIMPHVFERLFTRAGRRMEDYVQMRELPLQWRSFYEDGTRIDLHSDARKMEQQLDKLGSRARGYWEFVEHSRKLFRFCERAYIERGADNVFEIMRGEKLMDVVRGTDIFTSTMHSGVARFIKHPHLRDMLDFFIKYVGSSAYRAPALFNLLPYSQLAYGLWYVDGGLYNLARAYKKLLEELDVEIQLGAEVRRIVKEGKTVSGIELADGRRIAADVVVSNMEVIPTYRHLLDEGGMMMRKYEALYEPAASGLVVHLGVRRRYPQLAHHNFFFSRDQKRFFQTIHEQKRLPDDPTIYVVCPTRTDPTLAPADHEIVKILPHLPYVQDQPFTADDYEQLKQRVIEKLERMGLEGLREDTVVEQVLTPDDIEQMYRSNRGSIYGVVADWRRNFGFKGPKKSSKYKNLFFVGGSVNPGGGTPMVVLSGQLAADQIIRELGI